MKKAGGGLRAQRLPPNGVFVGRFYCRRDWKEMEQEGANETGIGECGRLEEESSSIESSRKMERWRDGTHAYDEKRMKERKIGVE